MESTGTVTSGWEATLKAIVNPQRRVELYGTVWTPAGHWSGLIRDHGSAIGIWDDNTKRMTWVDTDHVVAITQDPAQ